MVGDQRKPQLMELFGLPGAGKSAVVNAIHEDPSVFGGGLVQPQPLVYRGLSRRGRLGYQLRLHWRLRRLALAAYRLTAGGGLAGRAGVRVVPALLVDAERLRHAAAQMQPDHSCLFKQGPLQQLRAVVARTPGADDRSVTRVIAELHAVAGPAFQWTVVHLDTSAATAAGRIAGRPKSMGQYDRMAPDARLEALTVEATVQERMLRSLSAQGWARIVRLDGELPRDILHVAAPVILRSDPAAADLFHLAGQEHMHEGVPSQPLETAPPS